MAITDIYAKRRRLLRRAGRPQVLEYDQLPEPFRVQVIHILDDALAVDGSGWEFVRNALCRELGVFQLVSMPQGTRYLLPQAEQCRRFMGEADTDNALSLIELAFRWIDRVVRDYSGYQASRLGITQEPDEAIEELNHRFREHGLGYQYVEGSIVRVDSQYLHDDAVGPAVALLHQLGFEGPSDEFMTAHEHFRHGRTEDAITNALKAFESTMKAICEARGWRFEETDSANTLIGIMFDNGLVPPYLQSHFGSLRSTLSSGLPTVRNRRGGHGQGIRRVEVPDYLAAYALHLAATNIVLLVEAHKALPEP